jgi:hypothetical protein
MQATRAVGVAVVVLLLAAMPVLAHHSFKAEYDPDHPITLKGKVTDVTWKNPHVHFHMNVTGPDGKVTNWEMELGSPNLLSQGWTLSSLRTGDEVTVEGYPAKNGAKIVNARKVTLAAH